MHSPELRAALCDEVDMDKFKGTSPFVVYFHRRPDGSIFYVGKGTKYRALEFANSRRSLWHNNVVAKYGRANIKVEMIPCANEAEAFALEKVHIAVARKRGESIVNMTDGGEGVSGRKASAKSLAALKTWQGAYSRLDDQAKANILAGLALGRERSKAWKASPAGVSHIKQLAEEAKVRLHAEHTEHCVECGVAFNTRSAKKSQCCGKRCAQRRYRRNRDASKAL